MYPNVPTFSAEFVKPKLENVVTPQFAQGYNWAKKEHAHGVPLHEIAQVAQGFNAVDRGIRKYVEEKSR